MAALAGLVVLGSCVKDDESASVIASRNAKAAQLNADATLKQAQAANQTALAAYNLADAAEKTAMARQQEVLADIAEATKADDIAAALADAEKVLAQNERDWQAAINQMKQNERTEITNLIGDYQAAVVNYQLALNDVFVKQADLQSAKLDEEYAKQALADNISFDKKMLAQWQAKLEALEKMETTGMTAAERDAEVAIKTTERDNARSEFDQSAEVAAMVAASKAIKPLNEANDKAQAKWADFNNFLGGHGLAPVVTPINMNEYKAVENTDLLYQFKVFNYYTYNNSNVDINWGVYSIWFNEYAVNETNKLAADDTFKNNVELREEWLADDEDLLGTTADTKTTKTKRDANKVGGVQLPTRYADLALAKDTLKFWQDSLTKIIALPDTDPTKAAKKAEAEGNINPFEMDVDLAETAVANQLDAVANSKVWLKDDQEEKAEYEKYLAEVTPEGLTKAGDDLGKAMVAYSKTVTPVLEARKAINELQNEINALNSITTQNIDDQIADAKERIAFYEDQIADAERLIDPASGVSYAELIAEAEADLEIAQAQLEVSKAELQVAKEALEEVIGEFDEDDEDDEEGGEG